MSHNLDPFSPDDAPEFDVSTEPLVADAPVSSVSRRRFVARTTAGAAAVAATGLMVPSGIVLAQTSAPIEQRGDPADEGDGAEEPYTEPEDEVENDEPEVELDLEEEPESEEELELEPTEEPADDEGGSDQPSVILDDAERSEDRYFALTGHNLGAPFLEAWVQAGGESGPGLPLSEVRFVAGPGVIRQDFEALAFVYDPTVETGDPVQAVPLPPEAYSGLADAAAFQPVSGCELGESNCRLIAETGHTVKGVIATVWRQGGGARVLGNPLSQEFKKLGVTSQIFESAVVDVDSAGTATIRKLNTALSAAAFADDPAFLPAPPSLGKTTLVTASDGLRIRAKPGTNGDIITVIAENTEFIAAQGDHSDWVPGYADGFSGWVSSEYLKEPQALPELAKEEWLLDVWQGAALSDTALRAAPQMASAVVRSLAFGEQVIVVDWVDGEKVIDIDGIWAQTSEGAFVYGRDLGRSAPVQPTPLPPQAPKIGKWIDIHLTQQLLTAYEGQQAVRTVVITSGKPGWETPEGSFAINTRVANETMDSGAIGAEEFYKLEDVLFTQYFTDKGHALHFAWWKTKETIGRPGSHGCINLLLDDARFLWEWSETGTGVNLRY